MHLLTEIMTKQNMSVHTWCHWTNYFTCFHCL